MTAGGVTARFGRAMISPAHRRGGGAPPIPHTAPQGPFRNGGTLMNAYLDAMRHYATFTGRTSRAGFWLYILFYIIIVMIAGVLDMMLFGDHYENGGPIAGIVGLVHLVPGLAIGVRRLHDIDRTGWWLLLSFTGIGLIVLLIFNILSGTPGPNRYGPDPRSYVG